MKHKGLLLFSWDWWLIGISTEITISMIHSAQKDDQWLVLAWNYHVMYNVKGPELYMTLICLTSNNPFISYITCILIAAMCLY